MQCADMRGQPMTLQIIDEEETWGVNRNYNFYLTVNSCEKFIPITGQTDCVSQAESRAMFNKIYAITKIKQ